MRGEPYCPYHIGHAKQRKFLKKNPPKHGSNNARAHSSEERDC